MYLEYWQLAVLGAVFFAGMVHSAMAAKRESISTTVESMLEHLEANGYVKFEEIDHGEEVEYRLLKPTAFEEI